MVPAVWENADVDVTNSSVGKDTNEFSESNKQANGITI